MKNYMAPNFLYDLHLPFKVYVNVYGKNMFCSNNLE